MREITATQITETVKKLFLTAAVDLGCDVLTAFEKGQAEEESPVGREIFGRLLENARIAKETGLPLCQDTGLGIVFLELGQDVHVVGGDLNAAVEEGMRQAYAEGYLRKSVCHPLTRKNTGDNTPAIIHLDVVPGDRLKIFAVAKGGGSENMSRLFMLRPADGWAGIKDRVLQTVNEAGPNPCPPIILGVAMGGCYELAAKEAKRALLRPLGSVNPDPEAAVLEKELLEAVNDLGIGPMGLGGRNTCLGVHLKIMPCHIASLPLAVNVQCHASRHAEAIL
ncbi:MAG: fumarate hydratase [Deltaproteobacteria bacterium]|nr:fumarate hydratase [Deltaproteobacteria bacterium]